MLSERQKRVSVMRQFELQYPKYPLQILERLTNFRYRMFEQQRGMEMLATVLASSFDFYEHRLNLAKHGFSVNSQVKFRLSQIKFRCMSTAERYKQRIFSHKISKLCLHCFSRTKTSQNDVLHHIEKFYMRKMTPLQRLA
jgi:hypothetical protein